MNTNSTSSTPPPADLARAFERELGSADGARAAALDGLARLRAAKGTSLQREHARLLARYGKEDPRVLRLEQKQSANQRFVGVIGVLASQARVADLDAKPGTFVVHGFVRDQALKALKGLTVQLVDGRGHWIEAFGRVCTDADGYFRLENREVGDRLEVSADTVASKASVRIQVLDAKEKVLHTGKDPVTVASGQVEFREIVLGDDACGCGPDDSAQPTGASGHPAAATGGVMSTSDVRPPTAQPAKSTPHKRRKPSS
ncbi:MAG: hypothetical protein JNK85_06495 [Verrucomicrobiales bacterium]|nr:hypothetical protein [Verrucomicrobiales bacterium]